MSREASQCSAPFPSAHPITAPVLQSAKLSPQNPDSSKGPESVEHVNRRRGSSSTSPSASRLRPQLKPPPGPTQLTLDIAGRTRGRPASVRFDQRRQRRKPSPQNTSFPKLPSPCCPP